MRRPADEDWCPFHAPTHCTPSMRSSPCRSHFVCRPVLDLIAARSLNCNSSSTSAAGTPVALVHHPTTAHSSAAALQWPLLPLPCKAVDAGTDGCAYNGGSGMASAARRGTQLSRGRLRSEADTTGGQSQIGGQFPGQHPRAAAQLKTWALPRAQAAPAAPAGEPIKTTAEGEVVSGVKQAALQR